MSPSEIFPTRPSSDPGESRQQLPMVLRSPFDGPAHSRSPSRRTLADEDATSLRTSRASSIVSTRTKVSINTLQEDARSIDLVVGNQSFRIARDGSRVTTVAQENLPPYSTGVPSLFLQDDMVSVISGSSGANDTGTLASRRSRSGSDASNATATAELMSEEREHHRNESSTRDGQTNDDLYNSEGNTTPLSSNTPVSQPGSRNRSFSSLSREDPRKTPSRQSSWIGSTFSYLFGNSARNQEQKKVGSVGTSSDKTSTNLSSVETFPKFEDVSTPTTDVLSDDIDPTWKQLGAAFRTQSGDLSQSPIGESSTSNIEDPSKDLPPPPTPPKPYTYPASLPDTDSEVRTHYLTMLRTIDRAHRLTVHTKDKALASLRTRLNEMDQVYRQQLRQRDFTIDDLKRRLDYLEEQTGKMVEKAKHEVEDLWEERWKERDKHLMERMRRMERDGQRVVEKALEERDRIWREKDRIWRERERKLLLERIERLKRGGPDLPTPVTMYEGT